MKAILRLTSAMLAIAASALWTLPVFAATNQSTDPGGGGVSLTGSGNVTVNASSLQLVKQVYDSGGNCLASAPADATCNSSATSVTVATNTSLKFMIFVRNATDVAISDARFQDVLDESGTGFTYSAGTIKYSTSQTDAATIASIYTATNGGTAQTDVLGAPDDFASKVGSTFTVGAVTGQVNQSVNVIARRTFAVIFNATKN